MKFFSVFAPLNRWVRIIVLPMALLIPLLIAGCDDGAEEKIVSRYVTEHPSATSAEIAKATGVDEEIVKRVISKLPQPPKPEHIVLTPKELNEKHGPSVVNIYSNKALGSGVIYKSMDGYAYIITNDHVIRGASSLLVRLSDKRTLDAKMVGTDSRTDIAVLKVEGNNLQAAQFGDSSKVETGINVVAIGNPMGSENSIEDGLISKSEVTAADFNGKNVNEYLQTSASINPGNSGGPLFNMYGEVIGINDMGLTKAQNMNFAIPSNKAVEIADKLIANGYVSWPYLGVEAENQQTKDGTNIILVKDIMNDSPAKKVGLQKGDIIIEVNDAQVSSVAELRDKLNNDGVGASVSINYARKTKQGYKKFNVQVKLEELPKGYYTFDWS